MAEQRRNHDGDAGAIQETGDWVSSGGFPVPLALRWEKEPQQMEVQLTADQRAFARRAVEAGRPHSEEEAVQEALRLWEDRERRRIELLPPSPCRN